MTDSWPVGVEVVGGALVVALVLFAVGAVLEWLAARWLERKR